MPTQRNPSVRGWRIGATNSPPTPPQQRREDETIADPAAPRHWVDHSLQRQRTLSSLVLAATGSTDALDPHPDLIRAAKHHGAPIDRPCPWCKGTHMVVLRYVFSDELGPFNGRLKTPVELEEMAPNFGFLDVYVVEVCPDCHWNHLLHTYVLGDGHQRPPLRRPADLLD